MRQVVATAEPNQLGKLKYSTDRRNQLRAHVTRTDEYAGNVANLESSESMLIQELGNSENGFIHII